MLSKIKQKEYSHLGILSNTSWSMMLDKYKDDNVQLVISEAIEFLVYNEEESMVEFFGERILDVASKVSLKIAKNEGNIPREVVLQSREVTKTLTDCTRKVVFDNKEKING